MSRVYHLLAKVGGVSGIALLLLIVGWSRLTTLETLASPPSEQIGIEACPTGPTINFNPTNPSPGQSVHFIGNISGGSGTITFTWNFGDGSATVNGQAQDYRYTLNGIYTVLLTATGQACAAPPVASKNITVGFGFPAAVLYLPLVFKNVNSPVFTTGNVSLLVAPLSPAQVNGLIGHTDPASGLTRLEWLPPSSEPITGYRVYRRGPAGDEVFSLPATQTTFTDDTTACGYSYYVTAFNEAGESAASAGSYYGVGCR